MPDSKLDALRADLGVEINQLRLQAGDVLLVHPRHEDLTMSPQYCEWLKDTLYAALPKGSRLIVVATNDMFYRQLRCEVPGHYDSFEEDKAYEHGWNAALAAIQQTRTELSLRGDHERL